MKSKSKQDNLLAKIADAIQSGRYMISSHAFQRAKDRLVPVPHVEHVLLNGFHEPRKDKFEPLFDSWNYAIRGSTPDQVKVRLVKYKGIPTSLRFSGYVGFAKLAVSRLRLVNLDQ